MFYCICILMSAQQKNVGAAVATLRWWPVAKPLSTDKYVYKGHDGKSRRALKEWQLSLQIEHNWLHWHSICCMVLCYCLIAVVKLCRWSARLKDVRWLYNNCKDCSQEDCKLNKNCKPCKVCSDTIKFRLTSIVSLTRIASFTNIARVAKIASLAKITRYTRFTSIARFAKLKDTTKLHKVCNACES